jgi:cytochrome c2
MFSIKPRHWKIVLGLLALIAWLSPLPARAGGWATISLDNWPGNVIAGQPLKIGFMVRQHGRTPLPGLTPDVHATHVESGKTLQVSAHEDGPPGHYAAELILDQPGSWTWSIQAFTMLQPLPPLQVIPPSQATQPSTRLPVWPAAIAGLMSLVTLGFAARLSLRRRVRPAVALSLAGILLAALGLISLLADRTSISAQASQADSRMHEFTTLAPTAENGQILFIAKGCTTCHYLSALPEALKPKAGESPFSSGLGPRLPTERNDPVYLRAWLANPASIKPGTQMPNLELNSQEIEALVALLTAPGSSKQ